MPLNDTLFRFGMLMLFVPVLFAGLAGVVFTLSGLRRRRTMQSWPPVAARVLETEVKESRYSGVLGSKEMAWDLVVDYEYEAGGKAYMGQVSLEVAVPRRGGAVTQETLDATIDEAVERAKDNLAGGFVVHVDPEDPTRSMLAVEAGRWAWLRLILFAGAAAVGAVVLVTLFSG